MAPRHCPTKAPAKRSHLPALDGIRAFAFFLVFLSHYAGLPWGWAGVDIFFVLSGFLITGILLDTREETDAIRNFYIRRALRIFPLYYAVILLLAAGYPIFHWRLTWDWLAWPAYVGNFATGLHPATSNSPAALLANFELVSADGRVRLTLLHLWSLCVEAQFYLVWPWVISSVRSRKKLISICVLALIVCPSMRALAAHLMPQLFNPGGLYSWTPFRIDALLLGGLLALLMREGHAERLLRAGRIGFWAMSLTAVWWLAGSRINHRDYGNPSWQFTWGLLFIDILSACLIVCALNPSALTFKLLNLGPLRWLGRISYGAYVFHYIFYDELKDAVIRHQVHHIARTVSAIGLVLTLVLSWASFRWFESPFLRLKDRWTT